MSGGINHSFLQRCRADPSGSSGVLADLVDGYLFFRRLGGDGLVNAVTEMLAARVGHWSSSPRMRKASADGPSVMGSSAVTASGWNSAP